jgi:hypothetical protein
MHYDPYVCQQTGKALKEIRLCLKAIDRKVCLDAMYILTKQRFNIEKVLSEGEIYMWKLTNPVKIQDGELIAISISTNKVELYFRDLEEVDRIWCFDKEL